MTQHEAQHLVAELIREHDIKDEVLVGLFLGRVKRAVWDKPSLIYMAILEQIIAHLDPYERNEFLAYVERHPRNARE